MEERQRIGSISRDLMYGTAFFFDTLQWLFELTIAIPIAGSIISRMLVGGLTAVAAATFILWFKIKRVTVLERLKGKGWKVVLGFVASAVGEIFLPFYPGITVMVVMTVWAVRQDDKKISSGELTVEDLRQLDRIVQIRKKEGNIRAARAYLQYKSDQKERRKYQQKRVAQEARFTQARKLRNQAREAREENLYEEYDMAA